jgi:hypothetical protein
MMSELLNSIFKNIRGLFFRSYSLFKETECLIDDDNDVNYDNGIVDDYYHNPSIYHPVSLA